MLLHGQRCRWLSFVVLCVLWNSGLSFGHESPNAVIDALSHRIDEEGASAVLLVARAYEYRAFGDMVAAEADLKRALLLDESYGVAYVSLAQLYVYQDRSLEALEAVGVGLVRVVDVELRAGLRALSAEAHGLEGNWSSALREIDVALGVFSSELDWILLKSRVLRELELVEDRVEFVRSALEGNASVVLVIELVDALRVGRRFAECLRIVDGYIGKRRWKAEWLIRRAEVYVAMGDVGAAVADAQRSLDEIRVRLELGGDEEFLLELRAKARVLLDAQSEGVGGEVNDDEVGGAVSVTVLDILLGSDN